MLTPTIKEAPMPWFAWLIIAVALGSIVGGLLMLRDTAKPLPLSDEQLKRIKERNVQQDALDKREE